MKNIFVLLILIICIFFLVYLVSSCLSVYPNKINTKPQRHVGEQKGITVTVDLCPSSKPYEKRLFDALDTCGKKKGKLIPIYVCISGNWIKKHPADLVAINVYKNLDLIWVNHSYTHPTENGFLDNPRINFTQEVQANLNLMRNSSLTPSQYFRFPGLIQNQQRLQQIAQMGYINLDADAWLGKGQPIKEGSIILIHGNGNEQPGVIDAFIVFLKGYKGDIRNLKY